MKLSLPSPHEPYVDTETGKISEIWYRYLSQANTLASSLETASARAWGVVSNATSVSTLTTGYNISSVTGSTVGTVVVNLTNGFATTNYAVVVTPIGTTGNTVTISTGMASTTFTILANTTANPSGYSFACYGEQ